MIDIKKLTKADVGKWVIYTDRMSKEEIGMIKSWNDKFIFVVYKCDRKWYRFQDFTGCATDPKDLKFMVENTRRPNVNTIKKN